MSIFLQETYELEDCIIARLTETNITSTQSGTDNIVLLDNDFTANLPSKFEFSADIKTNINGARLLLGSKANASSVYYCIGSNRDSSRISAVHRSTSTSVWGISYSKDNDYHSFKFTRDNSSFTAYVDNTSQGSQTISWFDNYTDYTLYIDVWQSGTIYVRNIKLKPL